MAAAACYEEAPRVLRYSHRMGLFRRKTQEVQLPDATEEAIVKGTARAQHLLPPVGMYWFPLRAEPTNPVDRNAVAVWADKRVGYLPAEISWYFGPFIRRMESERFSPVTLGEVRQFQDGGRWILLRVPAYETVSALMRA